MAAGKTIREAIHGDVKLGAHEIRVIDTRVFQRLRGIKQLGMAYMVYPTATHTRFEHVIGCVHVAQRIIDQVQVDDSTVAALRERIRMGTLLHDLAHIPYGHTLEDELNILPEAHDSTEVRVPRFFERLKEEISSDEKPENGHLIELIDYALKTIKTIHHIEHEMWTDGQTNPNELPPGILPANEWFVADIVGNTICADLLDYARRDMRSAGLHQDYDDRLYSYFELANDRGGRRRLALRVAGQQGLRLDAVSEILNVLRIRYTLSERVLFHHAKNAASAMLGEALSYITFGPEAFDWMRDEELIPWISTQGHSVGLTPSNRDTLDRLISGLQGRRMHKVVFRVGPAQQAAYELANSRHLGIDFARTARRRSFQAEILEAFPRLRPGEVIVYCPPPTMRMKAVRANVLTRKDDSTCRPLNEELSPYLPTVMLNEIRELEEKYSALWSWTLLLAPDKLQWAFALQTFVREKLQISNDPFLQAYLEDRSDLVVGKRIMELAPGAHDIQGEAVGLAVTAAAAGPRDFSAQDYQRFVDEARRTIYGRE